MSDQNAVTESPIEGLGSIYAPVLEWLYSFEIVRQFKNVVRPIKHRLFGRNDIYFVVNAINREIRAGTRYRPASRRARPSFGRVRRARAAMRPRRFPPRIGALRSVSAPMAQSGPHQRHRGCSGANQREQDRWILGRVNAAAKWRKPRRHLLGMRCRDG